MKLLTIKLNMKSVWFLLAVLLLSSLGAEHFGNQDFFGGDPKSEDGNGFFRVIRVVDGDTIKVSMSGIEETVRLIGINSPESVDPRRPVECFGKEASQYLKGLLERVSVSLENDPTQGDRDKYGRLLRYVSTQNGTLVNEKMVAEGYAYEYTYDVPYRFQSEFKAAERAAREAGRGLWSEIACNGEK